MTWLHCINLENFGPVTPEFTKVKDVRPVVSFFKIKLSAWKVYLSESFRQIIRGSTEPIFTRFSPCGRYFIVNYWFNPLFPVAQGTLPWLPILGLKWTKSSRRTFIRRFIISKRSRISHFCDDLAILCKHLVNFGPVTLKFKRVKCVHPLSSFGYAAPLLDLVGISTQFCFSYSLGGVIDMPRRLHARLCYAFIVSVLFQGLVHVKRNSNKTLKHFLNVLEMF